MDESVIALSLIDDPSQPNGEALLFSTLVTFKLRSLLVRGRSDLICKSFPQLETVYYQNPIKLTAAHILGTLLSSEQPTSSVCASVLPLENLVKQCSSAMQYSTLKAFFTICAELIPAFTFIETSAFKDPMTNNCDVETCNSCSVACVPPAREATAELLVSALRQGLLDIRSRQAPSSSSSFRTPVKPHAGSSTPNPTLSPNPILDQWLRGLWELDLDPKCPSLHDISSRFSVINASLSGSDGDAGDVETPQTDSSSSSSSSTSPREDACLLIDARQALRTALLQQAQSEPVIPSTFTLSAHNTAGIGTSSGTGSSSHRGHPLQTLVPCLVLAEAFGCDQVQIPLLAALDSLSLHDEAVRDLLDVSLAKEQIPHLKIAIKMRLSEYRHTDDTHDSPLTDRDSLSSASTPSPYHTFSGHGVTLGTPVHPDPSHTLHGWSSAESTPMYAHGANVWPSPPRATAPVPQSRPAYPSIDTGRAAREEKRIRLKEEAHDRDWEREREELFDRSDSESDIGHSYESTDEREYEYESEEEEEEDYYGGQREREREQNAADECLNPTQRSVAELRPSHSAYEPPEREPTVTTSSRMSTKNHPIASAHSHSREFNRSVRSSQTPASYVENDLSRSLAGLRCRPILQEKRAKAAEEEAQRALRARRLKSLELTQKIARLGWERPHTPTNAALRGAHTSSVHTPNRFRIPASASSCEQSQSGRSTRPLEPVSRPSASSVISRPSHRPLTPSRTSIPNTQIKPTDQLIVDPSPIALEAQRRAARRIREHSAQLMTAQQRQEIQKSSRQKAAWAERDRRIQLFISRQKGGSLFLVSGQAQSRQLKCTGDGDGDVRNIQGGRGDVPGRLDQEHNEANSEVKEAQLAIHDRQPWMVGSPYVAPADHGAVIDPWPAHQQEAYANGYFLMRPPSTPISQHAGSNRAGLGTPMSEDVSYSDASGAGGMLGEGMAAALSWQDDDPPPPPPLSSVSITVLRARGLAEGLGGCAPYVVLDWSYLGKHSTEPPVPSASTRPSSNPEFGTKFSFKPPFLWKNHRDHDGAGLCSLYELDRELDGLEVFITTPSKGDPGATTTTPATLCGPLLRVLVYSRNDSVSDELLGEGEVDVETMMIAYQHGVSFRVDLEGTGRKQKGAGSVELQFEI